MQKHQWYFWASISNLAQRSAKFKSFFFSSCQSIKINQNATRHSNLDWFLHAVMKSKKLFLLGSPLVSSLVALNWIYFNQIWVLEKWFQINVGFGSRVLDFLDFSECQKKGPDHLAPGFGHR